MDDRFDDLLRDAAGEYNEPPETPHEQMWAAIQAKRTAEVEAAHQAKRAEGKAAEGAERAEARNPKVLHFRHFRSFGAYGIAAGIAAILALGIGLGRLTVDRRGALATPEPLAVETPRVSATAYRLITTEHLSQSEAFLTLFRASVRDRGDERLASATARQLLATNRLLLDSPAGSDARTRLLLQDLELVLAEIAQLSPQPESRDLDLITKGLEQGGMLSRLRTAVPAGTSATQGAL